MPPAVAGYYAVLAVLLLYLVVIFVLSLFKGFASIYTTDITNFTTKYMIMCMVLLYSKIFKMKKMKKK